MVCLERPGQCLRKRATSPGSRLSLSRPRDWCAPQHFQVYIISLTLCSAPADYGVFAIKPEISIDVGRKDLAHWAAVDPWISVAKAPIAFIPANIMIGTLVCMCDHNTCEGLWDGWSKCCSALTAHPVRRVTQYIREEMKATSSTPAGTGTPFCSPG